MKERENGDKTGAWPKNGLHKWRKKLNNSNSKLAATHAKIQPQQWKKT